MLHLQVTFGAEDFSVERWSHFRSVDVYDELCHWLKSGRLSIASSLCVQFSDVLSDKLVANLDATLAMVPDEVAVSELCAWLSHCIVPQVLELQDSEMIGRLAAWVEKRACDMEVTQKQGWPINAIHLCDVLQPSGGGALFKHVTPKEHACRIVGLAVPQTSWDEAQQSQNALVCLRTLRNDMQQIIEMRDKYNCLLSLAEFHSETVQSLAFHLLDRVVATELISAAISDMVCPYATQNCLNLDELLSSYVSELVRRRASGGMRSSVLWESKSIEILRSISKREVYNQTLLTILNSAQFPWSEEVSNAVQLALARSPSHAGLKVQCQLASLKQILIGYDLLSFSFAEGTHAKELAFHILVQDKATAVDDALAVTEVYGNVSRVDVYLFRCCFLAEHDRANEIVDLLRGITPTSLLDDVCERFSRYCSGVLSDPLSNFHSQYATAARHLRGLLTRLSSNCSEAIQHQLLEMYAIHRLDSEFDIFVSHNDYCMTAKRQQFYDDWLNSASTVNVNTTETKCIVERRTKMRRREVSRLLKVSAYNDVCQAVEAARDGNIYTVVELAERIIGSAAENGVEVVQNVLQILKALCERIETGSVVSEAELAAIHRVSCNLLLAAPSSMVDQCLRVVRSTRLAVEMAAQCSNDQSVVPLSYGVDPYRQWVYDDYLSDDDCGGVIMEPKPAMPLAFAFVEATLPSVESVFQPAVAVPRHIVDVSRKIAQLLTANDQTRLFLSYCLELAALVGGVSELEELNRAVLATLKQCVFQRRADYRLALKSVLSLSHPLARDNLRKLVRSAGIQYKKALAVAQVGRTFALLMQNTADLPLADVLVTEARWGYRLAKVHVSFHQCFGSGSDDKRSLIPALAANKSVSVDDVLQYCAEMKLDISENLSLYLSCLLLPSSDSLDVEPVVPFHIVRQRTEEACRHIKPKRLVNTLEKVFEKTSPYDYERLEFILDQLLSTLPSAAEKLDRSMELSTLERDKKLLGCLKSYIRVSAPSEEESLFGDAARERLPFHMLRVKEKHWRIITDELNADTVELWIPMAEILHLPADHIYTTAIRNIVQSHVAQLPSTPEWSEGGVDADFINTVQRLLSKVTSIELAVACVNWVARQQLPPGAEKVVAYTWCIGLLEKQVALSSPEQRPRTMEVLEKHRFYSRQTAIEQVCIYLPLAIARLCFKICSPNLRSGRSSFDTKYAFQQNSRSGGWQKFELSE